MTTEYSISVDSWQDERWIMRGRDVMRSLMEEEGTKQNKEAKQRAKDCGFKLDSVIDEFANENIPMMNYAYPLEYEIDDEKIAQICEETCCTVVEDETTGDMFFALCGGGMDLSQDVALARFEKKRQDVRNELNDFKEKTGLQDSLQKALDLIDDEDE